MEKVIKEGVQTKPSKGQSKAIKSRQYKRFENLTNHSGP